MDDIKLNLGCDRFKLTGFINIDINPEVDPNICMNLKDIKKYFENSSTDFIIANHVLEHLSLEEATNLLKDCFDILKPFRSLLVVVPDYMKCYNLSIELAERVIIAGGAHQILFDTDRLSSMLSKSGFRCFTEITNLNQVPYLLVSNVLDPQPDAWQTAFIALKT